MKNRKRLKGFGTLSSLLLVSLVGALPNLSLLMPTAAAATVWGVSSAYGALALACGASGPVGWAIFGLTVGWGA